MRKKIITFLMCSLLFMMQIPVIYAKDDTLPNDQNYHVVNVEKDGTYEVIKTTDTYAEAKVSHTLLKRKYSNLGITYGDSFLTIEQGIVEFATATDCSLNTSYTIDGTNAEGYTNGCYGIDGAFLEYNPASNKVKFKLSGVIGWADGKDVTIHPIETVPNVTSFTIRDGQLIHNLKSSLAYSSYDNSLDLGEAPSYLKDKKVYYSYDSHYFYTDFADMAEDYRTNTYSHAVNSKNPYYNYYQFMDHRSTSSYSLEDLDAYFKDTLAINQTITSFYDKDNYVHDILTQSLLPQAASAFFQYQNQFGANALMMLSLSLNESALGRSYLAYTRNNLFGHAAYDSAVEENASRYSSVSDSIYSHALHYISNSYLNPDQFQFYGGFFGNKAGGMNVAYASDPYWGEKAAQYYYEIDHAMGDKDKNQYALGITKGKKTTVYQEASKKSKPIYSMKEGYEATFILLEKITNKDGIWYRIQSDPALTDKRTVSKEGTYDFKNSYGYVKESDIVTVLNSNNIQQKNYVNITFDANGGTFYPESTTVMLQVENGKMPIVNAPAKDHALFNGWDIKVEAAKNNMTYKATYKEVKEIRLSEKPLTEYGVGDSLDVKDGVISVEFSDGSSKDVNLTTDMVSGFQSDKTGKQTLKITYAGCTVNYEIVVSKSQEEEEKTLQERAAYIIKTYSGKTNLNEEAHEELTQFLNDIVKMNTNILTKEQIRVIDRIFQENLEPRYSVIIKDSSHDTQISGLSLALQGEKNFLNSFMPKTLVVKVKDSISDDEEELAKKVATANHVTYETSLNISGTDDLSSLKLKQEVVFSVKKPKGSTDQKRYRVYYVDGDDVYQIPTSQSKNRILFTSDKLGSYVIASNSDTSIGQTDDYSEVNLIAQNGKNYITTYLILPACIIIVVIIGIIVDIIYRTKHPRKWKLKKFRKPRSEVQ